jgi:hypothetical protein
VTSVRQSLRATAQCETQRMHQLAMRHCLLCEAPPRNRTSCLGSITVLFCVAFSVAAGLRSSRYGLGFP